MISKDVIKISSKKFSYSIADSQGTSVYPIAVQDFDFDKYSEYEATLSPKNSDFWKRESGVLVHRRVRVPDVFSYRCKDMKVSLELQLGALEKSMSYKMDVANFLEPWYGIGTVASAFGAKYEWHENQAPAFKPPFNTVKEALAYDPTPVEKTNIGNHTLNMIEYFLDETKGRLPISLTDVQSPLNIAASIVNNNNLFLEMFDDIESIKQLFGIITDLLIDFTKKQYELLKDVLVKPGHGFTSSRNFSGLGLSDDNMIMISDNLYEQLQFPEFKKLAQEFGGIAFHSCGNWSRKVKLVKKIDKLLFVDGAFSEETDPQPNEYEPFAAEFPKTGVIINARIVGDSDTILSAVKNLWRPGMKMILVTYCQDTKEQEYVYEKIHEICCES